MNLARRYYRDELMDSATIGFQDFNACLRDIERINIATNAYAPTLRFLEALVQERPEPVSVLDVGFGGGDMMRRIRRWAVRHGVEMQITGIDISPWAAQSARAQTPVDMALAFVTADIHDYEPEAPFDVVISSLFTHHLADDELVRFLQWMEAHTRRGWFINDLHRHPLPFHVILHSSRLLRMNRLVRHDAPLSVARAFTRADWLRYLGMAGIAHDDVCLRWHFPFRYGLGRVK